METNVLIRRMNEEDIAGAAEVHAAAFPRQTHSKSWLECVYRAFPKSQSFVAEQAGKIVGVIFWTEKSGFRKEALVELEQIAVHPDVQGQGIGTKLIQISLPEVAKMISQRGAVLKNIVGNTRADNRAQELYKKILGAQAFGAVSGIFSTDEVYMVARDFKLLTAAIDDEHTN